MTDTKNLYDAVIIGGGPAGLTAALYLTRARYRVVVIEKDSFGGQIAITSEVVNYPGVKRVSGSELTGTMREQAEAFGADFLIAEVTGLDMEGDVKTIHTTQGDISAFGVLLATGAHPRRLGFEGEAEYAGRGVAYCATCDGEFFTDKEVFVVGGGYAAAEESMFLTKYAKHVTVMMRGGGFSCAQSITDKVQENEKITVLPHTEIDSVAGDAVLRSIRYHNVDTGAETEYAADNDSIGVFVFAGYVPASELVQDMSVTDDAGYVITDGQQQTTVPGLYAAGDVCAKPLRQVVTATGEAALAASMMERTLAKLREKTGFVPRIVYKDNAGVDAVTSATSTTDAVSSATRQSEELATCPTEETLTCPTEETLTCPSEETLTCP
ncbi:MAG TPA: thioredoxin reductase, partial [Coriobacteriia bacterium]|nr:thioredoxin reductase [Coriobacteriia bacterium]